MSDLTKFGGWSNPLEVDDEHSERVRRFGSQHTNIHDWAKAHTVKAPPERRAERREPSMASRADVRMLVGLSGHDAKRLARVRRNSPQYAATSEVS